MLSLLVGAWLSISPLEGQTDTTSVVVIEWWHDVNKDSVFNMDYYTVTDSVRDYKIYAIYEIDSLLNISNTTGDSLWDVPINTYLFGLIVEKVPCMAEMYCWTKTHGYDFLKIINSH